MSTKSQNPETIVLHAGYRSDPTTTAVAVPIYQTTSYQFHSTEHAGNLFALKELGNIYTRIMNPTQAVLEERVAALEGGVAALAVASGQAASLFAVQNICHAGDNFVCSTDIYGGTWNLFQNTMSTMGIECRFVDPADPENFRRARPTHARAAIMAKRYPILNLRYFRSRRSPRSDANSVCRSSWITRPADPVPAHQAWRRYHHALDDEVYRWPRYIDRRHNC